MLNKNSLHYLHNTQFSRGIKIFTYFIILFRRRNHQCVVLRNKTKIYLLHTCLHNNIHAVGEQNFFPVLQIIIGI